MVVVEQPYKKWSSKPRVLYICIYHTESYICIYHTESYILISNNTQIHANVSILYLLSITNVICNELICVISTNHDVYIYMTHMTYIFLHCIYSIYVVHCST